jgi:hypothetical protein
VSRHARNKELESGMKPPAAKPRQAAKDARHSVVAPAPASIGNSAAASLLHDDANVTPIPSQIRARMEQSFGVDLGAVRVHQDSRADSLDAEALVEAEEIHWGASAPPVESPEAAPLLAHEIAHVVQQSRAGSIENRVSSPQEASEAAAKVAAGQALAGQTASVAGGGAVAGAQRQPKKDTATDINQVAVEKITAYLKKVANTKPPQDIKKAKVVRTQLMKLAFSGGPSAVVFDVDAFLDAPGTSNDPATMATQFVNRVWRITQAALDQLEKAPFIDPQASTMARLSDLVTGSAPGKGPERPPEPGYVSPADRAEEISQKLNAMRGTKGPTTYGPGSIDVLQAARIIKGLKPTLTQKPTKPAEPMAETYPAVTEAIKKMPKDALIPAESKGKSDPDQWADTPTFAEGLARQMDLAQKNKKTEITVELGYNYANVKNRDALRDAVEAIIQQLRDALPHHATEVRYVKVTTGGKLLTIGTASQ